jgi:hypothetical protein
MNSRAHRIHYTPELSQRSISGILDDPSAALSDLAIDERAQVTLEPSVRALFILAGQAAVASHIGRKDGGQFTLDVVVPGRTSQNETRTAVTALSQRLF